MTYVDNELKLSIETAGCVTTAIRESFFKGQKVQDIRSWLENHGLDRHMPIELKSTEVAILTPFGIMMQIRATDHDQLGLWGGVLRDGEIPVEGAAREVEEETGIKIPLELFEFVEENDHFHEYANGDRAIFHTFRFKVVLDYVPKIKTDEESTGVYMLVHTVLSHQQEFIKRLLGEK